MPFSSSKLAFISWPICPIWRMPSPRFVTDCPKFRPPATISNRDFAFDTALVPPAVAPPLPALPPPPPMLWTEIPIESVPRVTMLPLFVTVAVSPLPPAPPLPPTRQRCSACRHLRWLRLHRQHRHLRQRSV